MTDFHFSPSKHNGNSWKMKVRSFKEDLALFLADRIKYALWDEEQTEVIQQCLLGNLLIIDFFFRTAEKEDKDGWLTVFDHYEDWYETHLFVVRDFHRDGTNGEVILSLVSFALFQVDQAIRIGRSQVCVNIPGGVNVYFHQLIERS